MLRMMKNKFLTRALLAPMSLAGLLVGIGVATLSCDAPDSKEALNPEGPPMIRQVFITEKVTINDSPRTLEGQLAFGQHDAEFFEDDDGTVATAIALGAQEIRIVFDEIIRGNRLEEIACADGSYSVIPDGTTPDEISKCAGPVDSLQDCDTVCLDPTGKPLGILDADDNGSADDFRMRDYNPDDNVVELGVALICDGETIPLDQEFSFWSPSGNQTFPSNSRLGFRGLGPALVLKPNKDSGLRTGAKCGIVFRDEVTDYDGNTVCAPLNGLPSEGCSGSDTGKISFSTEALSLMSTNLVDGATDVPVTTSAFMIFTFNANLDPSTLTGMTLKHGATNVPLTPKLTEDDASNVTINLADSFLPDTEYVFSIDAPLADKLGGTPKAAIVITFTTASATIVPDADLTPDASLPDAGTLDAA